MTAGNFYVNDKSTGAIVGQQAFGGGRHSGLFTNITFLLNIIKIGQIRLQITLNFRNKWQGWWTSLLLEMVNTTISERNICPITWCHVSIYEWIDWLFALVHAFNLNRDEMNFAKSIYVFQCLKCNVQCSVYWMKLDPIRPYSIFGDLIKKHSFPSNMSRNLIEIEEMISSQIQTCI